MGERPNLKRGDWVTPRSDWKHVGMVKRVAKDYSWCDVDWGPWSKRMKPEYLAKPKEIPAPGLSGNGLTAYLMQPDGEDPPAAKGA